MSYLKNKTTYLCGAMCALEDSGMQWREWITEKLSCFNLKILDPTRKISEGCEEVGENKTKFRQLVSEERFEDLKEAFDPVARWDLRSIDKSDFIIVNYDASVPSVGTWHELTIANIQKKPILMKYDKNQLHLFNHWIPILVKPKYLFPTWESIINHLEIVNTGVFDRTLWTL